MKEGLQCKTDADCVGPPWETCVKNVCKHKSVFPMQPLDFFGMIMTFLGLYYANIGGLGGGGLIVPIA